MKPIRLSRHAAANVVARGASEEEVGEAVAGSPWAAAERGRLECRRTFVYDQEWNGRHYALKEVRPIFVDEPKEIVVVTVYVYYR